MRKLRLIWDDEALKQRHEILAYYIKRNGSGTYSKKLLENWEVVLELICAFPEMGQRTRRSGVRRFVIGWHALFYRVKNDELHVEAIVDARRNIPLD